MKVVGGLTRFEGEWNGLRALLEALPAAVLLAPSPNELLRDLGRIKPDLIFVDSRIRDEDRTHLLERLSGALTTIEVWPRRADSAAALAAAGRWSYDALHLDDPPSAHEKVIERALERTSLLADCVPLPGPPPAPMSTNPTPADRPWEQALRSLSRVLSAGFDIDELLDHFLNLAVEVAGVARAAILVRDQDKGTFTVRASLGIFSSTLFQHAQPEDSGLFQLMLQEGRPVRQNDSSAASSPHRSTIARAFQILHSSVCIPIATRGAMLAVLSLGDRLNGAPPAEAHVEMLFTIGSHVAVALQNIRMHQELSRQKAQNDSVLEHMTNGIASIDSLGRITMFNRRAAEILGRDPGAVLGHDLRVLPAPLGDLLYEAIQTGAGQRHTILNLSGSGVPMEASTYPLFEGDSDETTGSVLVVEDISQRQALEASRLEAEQSDLFNRLISQLAHEIKNPLVAVKAFADLYQNRLSDPELEPFVMGTVIPEIARLDEIVGKLVDFINHNILDMRECRVEPILQELAGRVRTSYSELGINVTLTTAPELPSIRADVAVLTKGLWYFISHLVQSSLAAASTPRELQIEANVAGAPVGRVDLCLTPSWAWTKPEDVGRLFDPLLIQKDQLNLALPVARKIILEHRGDVEAIPNSAGGVSIHILLPVV